MYNSKHDGAVQLNNKRAPWKRTEEWNSDRRMRLMMESLRLPTTRTCQQTPYVLTLKNGNLSAWYFPGHGNIKICAAKHVAYSHSLSTLLLHAELCSGRLSGDLNPQAGQNNNQHVA